MNCQKCGKENEENSIECRHCGIVFAKYNSKVEKEHEEALNKIREKSRLESIKKVEELSELENEIHDEDEPDFVRTHNNEKQYSYKRKYKKSLMNKRKTSKQGKVNNLTVFNYRELKIYKPLQDLSTIFGFLKWLMVISGVVVFIYGYVLLDGNAVERAIGQFYISVGFIGGIITSSIFALISKAILLFLEMAKDINNISSKLYEDSE